MILRQRSGRAYGARSLLVVLVVLLGAACGTSEPVSTPAAPPRSCDELESEVADLVVDLAEHAAGSPAGLPPGPLDAEHPDDVDVWEIATALAAGSPDLEARVEAVADAARDAGCPPGWAHDAVDQQVSDRVSAGAERLEDDYDAEEHTTLNLMAILAANFAPPPETYDVPDGFPPEFPVHPGAHLTTSERRDDGSVTATWTIENGSLAAIADYYQAGLQEIRFGGWSVDSSTGGSSGEGGGRHSFEIVGYGFAGTVSIRADDDPGDVAVTARLKSSS